MIVCKGCGEVHEAATRRIERLEEEIELRNRLLAEERVAAKRLKSEQSRDLAKHKLYEPAVEVLHYWRDVLAPRSKAPLSDIRLRKVFKCLEGYSVEDLKRVVDGYAAFPYLAQYGKRLTDGTPDQRKVEAEYIFRDDAKVIEGLTLMERAESHEVTFAPTSPPALRSLGEIGERALALVKLGWHVFPCVPDQKVPATPHGFLDAKADPWAVSQYWERVPDANLAVRTGALSGVVVLDVDGEEGFASLRRLEAEFAQLPRTLSVVTPRGGQHFYFAHPGGEIRNTVGVPGPGLDFRGDGGYVLCPPSRVNGRPYEVDERALPAPMPEWLVRVIAEQQARVARKIAAGEWAQLMRECVQEGQRNDLITRIAGHKIALGQAPDEVVADLVNANRANFKPPLADREVEAVVVSIAQREARKPLRAVSA